MSTETIKKVPVSYWVHTIIGIAIMAIFWFLPAVDPITPVGMKVAGVFLGMIYLWSTVESVWPTLLGLTLMGLSGYAGEGYAGMKAMVKDAFGADTVVVIVLAMVLFGALEYLGATKYIAQWFITRKIINGRPYVFMFMFFLACYFLSAMTSPVISLLIVWSIGLDMLDAFGIKQGHSLYAPFNFGTFLISTLGQPMMPFKGAVLVVVGAYEQATGLTMDLGGWMLLNFTMSMIILAFYFLFMRFILKVDVTPLKEINVEYFKQRPLPPMNKPQQLSIIVLFVYIILLLIPGFFPKSIPFVGLLARLGLLGVTMLCLFFMMIVHIDGEQVLPFGKVASRHLNWNVVFLIIGAIYAAGALSNDNTGIKEFLIMALDPILGGRSPLVFGAIMFTVALVLTNFANNAAMAVALVPVCVAFTEQMGVDSHPFMAGIGMMVFVAMLTPAASPHAGMMHGRKDLISTSQILKYGFPMCIVSLLVYIFLGLPLAGVLL